MNPLGDAEREFEQHERDLWDQLMARVQGAVPMGATVGEAMKAMERAADGDPGVQELVFRIMAIARMGGGAYLRAQLEEPLPPPPVERVYRLTEQPTKPLVQEEIRLMDRLRREIEARLGPEPEGPERRARIRDLLAEDEELAELAARLEKLSLSHDESVMFGLAKLAEEEELEDEDEDEDENWDWDY